MVAACTSIDCPVKPHRVYHAIPLNNPDGTPDTLDIDTLWVLTTRADGTDYGGAERSERHYSHGFDLPISYTQPEDTFPHYAKWTRRTAMVDTICREEGELSTLRVVDCQATYFHTITAVRVRSTSSTP